MSGQEGGPSNNANLGHSRGGRGQNAYSRGRGGGVGPAQRGTDGPGGRNGGRGGGRTGQSYDRIMPGQQPRRPDVHAPQYSQYLNAGGQRAQGQQYGTTGSSLPPGVGGAPIPIQFGSIQLNEVPLFGTGQQANAPQAPFMNRAQHGIPPQPQQQQQQQPKMHHQQHAAKVSQAGLAMQPGMHTQGPQGMHAYQQIMMQGHQGQPNQPPFMPQHYHAGPHGIVPPGVMMGGQFQPSPQQLPQQPQQLPYVPPTPRPAVKRPLVIMDPTTQKPVDISSSAASANGTASRPRTANAQDAKRAAVRSLSEASRRQPPGDAKSKQASLIAPSEKRGIPIIKPPDAAGAGAAGKTEIVLAMAAASLRGEKPADAPTAAPAQNGPASVSVARPAMKVPEDKLVPAPTPAAPAKAPEKLLVPEDKPAPAATQPAAMQPAATLPAITRPAAAAKAEQAQASAPAKDAQKAPAHPVAPMLSVAARVKQAAAPKVPPMPVPEPQVPAKEETVAAPEVLAPKPVTAGSGTAAAVIPKQVVAEKGPAVTEAVEEPVPKAAVPSEKPSPLPPATPQSAEPKAPAPVVTPVAEEAAPTEAEKKAPLKEAPAARPDDAAAVSNGEVSVEAGADLASAAEAVKEAAEQQPPAPQLPSETPELAKDAELSAAKDDEPKGSPEAAGEKGGAHAVNAKAKRKAFLAKADTEGTKGSMLDAFVTPPPPKPDSDQDAVLKIATSDKAAQAPAKAEATKEEADGFEDWEAAAEGMATPSAALAAERSAAARASVDDSSGRKKYTRDWLLTYQHQCSDVPAGLDDSDVQRGDGGGAGGGRLGPGGGFDRGGPRGSGGHPPPALGPPGIGMVPGGAPGLDSKRWDRGSMRPPDGMGPPPGPPGMGGRGMMGPGPPMGGRGGRGMVGIDGAKWQRGLQPPPPPPGMQGGGFGGPPRGYGGAAAMLHKTENRYKLGLLVSEDPDEEKRQKEFKSMLNKITPDNYETIRDKIIAVGITSPGTLQGLIDQVFDKALSEPSFSEIYATLCFDLNKELPSFKDEAGEEGAQEITFRRILLNKCQEEFEEGDAAMKAVEAREKAEQEKADAKAEGKDEEEKEDGEITPEEKQQKQRDDRLAAQLELKARRRALGNIQFIGQLYKQKMLTEKIMHSCIFTLLGEVENIKAEDVECLVKLLVTIGAPLDANPKNKDRMEAYFSRLGRLSAHPKLESRHKFMVQDVIELRAHNWVARRKVEGPKKIEDIHKDARMELQRQRMAPMPDRGDRRRGGPPMDRAPLPQRPVERSDRVDAPIRPMNRAPSQEWLTQSSLRPGGGAPRTSPAEPTVSLRPGGPGAAGAGAGARSASGSSLRTPSPARDVSPAPAAAPAQEPEPKVEEMKELPREVVEGRAKLLAKEFLSNADIKELVLSLRELQQHRADFVVVIEGFFNGTFEAKNVDRNELLDLLIRITTPPESVVKGDVVERALKVVLDSLDQTIIDVPFASTLVGQAIGTLAAKGVVSLKSLAEHVLTAESPDAEPREEGEDTVLVDMDGAVKLIAAALSQFRQDSSVQETVKAWRETGLDLTSFMPSYERKDAGALPKLLVKQGLQFLYPLAGVEQYLPGALKEGKSADEIIAWVDQDASDACSLPEFSRFVTLQVLQSSLGDGKEVNLDGPALAESSTEVKVVRKASGAEGPKDLQQAVIAATVEFFAQSAGRKGLLRRLLTDLHAAEVVSGAALQAWRYNTNDTEAVKDVSTWLDELKESDEQEEE